MKSRNEHEQKLKSLEKWRNLELDQAQAEHVKMLSKAAGNERALAAVRDTIADSQDRVRAETSDNRIISVDALTRLRHYTTVQTGELKKAQTSLEEAQREVATARKTLLKKHENVSVVERLRKRREVQAAKDGLRREQKRLDDQALLRVRRTTASKD
jgi:flagellar export protein FliJ